MNARAAREPARSAVGRIPFIRRNNAWGHSAGGVSPQQVQAIREAEASRSEAWTGEELQWIPVSQ